MTRGTPLSANVIINRKENAIVIPPSALRTIGSRTYVQVWKRTAASAKSTSRSASRRRRVAEILEGLDAGTESRRSISDGMPLYPFLFRKMWNTRWLTLSTLAG